MARFNTKLYNEFLTLPMVDKLVPELALRSAISNAQIETIVLRGRVLSGELPPKDAASLRSRGPVKIGSFFRVLHQGKRNLEKSIFSVLVGIRLGVLKQDELSRLFSLVAKPSEMDEDAAAEVMAILEPLVRRLVTL